MKKRLISFCLTMVLCVTMCVPAVFARESDNQLESPDTLVVEISDNHYSVSSASMQTTAENSNVFVFERVSQNFYRTNNAEFPDNFRLALEEDGSLLPLTATEIDLSSNNPISQIAPEVRSGMSEQQLAEIEQIANSDGVETLTLYSQYSDYTTVVNGKTVKTNFVEYSGVATNGGKKIATYGEHDFETEDDLYNNIKLTVDSVASYTRVSPLVIRLGKLFATTAARKLIQEYFASASTSKCYVMLCPRYQAVMRYTEVQENGMMYPGCTANKVDVYPDCVFYSGQGISVDGKSSSYYSYESRYFSNAEAERMAVNNYMTGGFVDKMDDYSVAVRLPDGYTKAYYFGVT